MRRPRSMPFVALLLVLLQGGVLAQAAFAFPGAGCECAHPETVDCDCPHHREARAPSMSCHRRKPAQATPGSSAPRVKARCATPKATLHLLPIVQVPRRALARPLPPRPRDLPFLPPPGMARELPSRPARPPPRA